jgi:hypothetical protein
MGGFNAVEHGSILRWNHSSYTILFFFTFFLIASKITQNAWVMKGTGYHMYLGYPFRKGTLHVSFPHVCPIQENALQSTRMGFRLQPNPPPPLM